MPPAVASTPAPLTIVPPISASRAIRTGRPSRQTPEAQVPSPEPCKFQVTVQTDGSEHTVPAEPKLRVQLAKQLCADYGESQKVLSRYFAKPVDGKCYGQFKFQVNTVNKAPTCTEHCHLFDPEGTCTVAFLKWGYSLGEINKNNKMTANVAAEVMPLVGTMAGEVKLTPPVGAVDPYMKANTNGIATFRVKELLDVWRIKPWFSQQKQAFNKKLQAAAKAAAEFVAGATGEGSLEVDDVDLDEQVVDEDE